MFRGAISEDHRRERPERFAHLHQRVDPVAHLLSSRIRQDRAGAKRTRPEFRLTGEPPDDLPRSQALRNLIQKDVRLAAVIVMGDPGNLK